MLFRRRPNLKDNIVRAKLPWIHTEVVKGCSRCGKSRCQVCSFISEGSSLSCNVSGKQYSINSSFNCDSSGVVYVLGCRACGKQYVGAGITTISLRVASFLIVCQLRRQSFLVIYMKLTITDFKMVLFKL